MRIEPPSAANAKEEGAVHLLTNLPSSHNRLFDKGETISYSPGILDHSHFYIRGHCRQSSDTAACIPAATGGNDYYLEASSLPSSPISTSQHGRRNRYFGLLNDLTILPSYLPSSSDRLHDDGDSSTFCQIFFNGGVGVLSMLKESMLKRVSYLLSLGRSTTLTILSRTKSSISSIDQLVPPTPSLHGILKLMHSILCTCFYMLGLGRNPRSCLPWRSLLWFYTNRPKFESLCASYQHPPFFHPCPILQSLGEPIFAWDAFQIYVFVVSSGYFYAERHASVTKDNHLLISHRLVAVPTSIQSQLHTLQHTSLTLLVICFLQNIANVFLRRFTSHSRLVTSEADLSPLQGKAQTGSLSGCGDSTTRDTTAGGMDSYDTGSACDGPFSSMSPFDARRQSPSIGGCSSANSSVYSETPQVRRSRPTGTEGSSSSSPSATPSVDVRSAISHDAIRPIVLLQHGLLESSLNWIGAANVNDPMTYTNYSLPRSILVHVIHEMREFRRILTALFWKGGKELSDPYTDSSPSSASSPTSATTSISSSSSPPEGLEKAVPFHLFAKGLDVWFSNSRGNSFSRIEWNKRPYSPPLGWRRFRWDDFMGMKAVYTQDWTYNDMAIYDLAAVQTTISSVTKTAPAQLRPVLVGFSQGAALVLLSTAHVASQMTSEASGLHWNPRALILVSPPLITTPHFQSTKPLLESGAASTHAPCVATDTARQHQKQRIIDKIVALLTTVADKVLSGNSVFRNWRGGTGGVLTPLFFDLARDHLGPLAIFVDCCSMFIPTRIHQFIAQYATFTGLRFYYKKLPDPVSAVMYSNTPSGLTSQTNMRLWLNRVASGEPVDYHFLQKLKRICDRKPADNEDIFKQNEDDGGSPAIRQASKTCKIQVWLGAQDNICWPERCIQYINQSSDDVTIWDTSYHALGKQEQLVQKREAGGGRSSHNPISVKRVQSMGHVDFTWCGIADCVRDLACEIHAYALGNC